MREKSAASSMVDNLERRFIAATLGLMTLVTFANVVARYVFNSNILWALELTVFLFAWLVLIGASYGVKHTFHIGVDVVVVMLPKRIRYFVTMLAAACCILFAALLLIGSWNYWSPFIGKQSFYETVDIPNPFFLAWLKDVFNDGEAYGKLPRFIPYFALPLGMAMLLFRFLEAGYRIAIGTQDGLIANHEVEELMEEVAGQHKAASPGEKK